MKRHKRGQINFECIVSDRNNVPGFYGPDSKWLASAELVLLTSLHHYSFGNWSLHAENLSNSCNKRFTAEEVREHYINTYLEGEIAEAMKNVRNVKFKSSLIDHTTDEDDELLNSSDINAYKNVPESFLHQIGYMPLRVEFKEDYAASAEDLIYDINFKKVDKYDKNYNFLVLDAYRNKVKERAKLKNAIMELRLVERYYAASKNKLNSLNPGNKINNLSLGNKSPVRKRRNSRSDSMHNNLKEHVFEELSEAEKELCLDMGIKQTFYINYRRFLQRIDMKKVTGELTYDLPMIPDDMTVAQCLRIINYLKKSGWIKTKNFLSVLDE